jgi:hypothetical protein
MGSDFLIEMKLSRPPERNRLRLQVPDIAIGFSCYLQDGVGTIKSEF